MRSGTEDPCDQITKLEAIPDESIIVISDDEFDVTLGLGNSVLLIEDENEDSILNAKKTLEVVDEDLAVTFSRRAHVMPHARYDCSTHPFNRMEQETQVPIEENSSYCDECYCYLCDKPASECSKWQSLGCCHCNAHNKSKYWKDQRDTALVGVLTMFNLDLTEIDTELKEGGRKLQLFLSDLTAAYHKYLEGSMMKRDTVERCFCSCHKGNVETNGCMSCPLSHTQVKFHNYSEVHKTVTKYLNKVDEESPKAAAVMLLGTAKELVFHKALPNPFTLKDQASNIKESSVLLMKRIVTALQRLLVLKDYPKTLYDKFISVFQSFPLPPHFFTFISSLNIMRWDHCLLTSVLAGQNLTGTRTNKGKKECLFELLTVVQARVKKLEEEGSYRQLVRYLNAVQCLELTSLNSLRQKLCFYMCKFGDFSSAATSLLHTKGMQGGISSYFTPELYEVHMLMLRTRSYPSDNKLEFSDLWIPSSGPPLKSGVLLRTALRILLCNNHLYHESKCWSALVRVWCTKETLSIEGKLLPMCLYEPDKILLQTVIDISSTILDDLQMQANVHLPEAFHKSFSSCSELILIVQGVKRYLTTTNAHLRGMLELVVAFGLNHWALSLLIEGITPEPSLLFKFAASVNQELYENAQRILELVRRRGSDYMTRLVPLFLLHPCDGIRSIGFNFIDLVLRNMSDLPWSAALGNSLRKKVVPHTYRISTIERQQLMANIGKLTKRSLI